MIIIIYIIIVNDTFVNKVSAKQIYRIWWINQAEKEVYFLKKRFACVCLRVDMKA